MSKTYKVYCYSESDTSPFLEKDFDSLEAVWRFIVPERTITYTVYEKSERQMHILETIKLKGGEPIVVDIGNGEEFGITLCHHPESKTISFLAPAGDIW